MLLAAATTTGLLPALTTAVTALPASPTLRLAHMKPAGQEALLRTLLFLPVAGVRRPWHLRTYTDATLALLSGRPLAYGHRPVARFLRELADSGGAEPLTAALAGWTARLWASLASAFYYIDGHRKPVYTSVAIPRGLIGRTGKILGCRALVLLHDAAGHPLLATTHRGDRPLTQGLPDIVARYHQASAHVPAATLVVDREGMSGPFLAERLAAGQRVVTILRTNQYTDLTSFSAVGPWQPLRTDATGRVVREVAAAQFPLRAADTTQAGLLLNVALIRDHQQQEPLPGPNKESGDDWTSDLQGAARWWWKEGWMATPLPAPPTGPRLIPIVTTAQGVDPVELVRHYTARWPCQENVIRDWLLPLGLDTNHGYTKQAVVNSEQDKKRGALNARLERVRRWAERARQQAERARGRYGRRWRQAKTRQQELDRALVRQQLALEQQGLPQWELRQRLRAAQQEAETELLALFAQAERAQDESERETKKLERYCAEQRRVLRALEDLATRDRSMYEMVNDQDQIMTVLKLALANLGMWVRERWFPPAYAAATWRRLAPFFALSGRITADATTLQVDLRPFNDRQLTRDLRELCERVTAANPELPDGRRLVLRLTGRQCFISDGSIRAVA